MADSDFSFRTLHLWLSRVPWSSFEWWTLIGCVQSHPTVWKERNNLRALGIFLSSTGLTSLSIDSVGDVTDHNSRMRDNSVGTQSISDQSSRVPLEASGTGGSIPRTATAREWVGVIILTIPCLIVSMDLSILYFALPKISESLAPTSTQQLWIMDAYGFLLAGLLITMGATGDRVGRRLLLLIGAGAFGVASAIAAMAGSPETLIAARAVMGIAGATLMPSTLALIRTMFEDPRQRTKAIGIWNGGLASGAAIGPVAGGLLLEHFWWGSVFLVNVPIMIVLLALGPLFLPETRDRSAGRIDIVSALLSIVAVLVLIQGIKEWARVGFGIGILILIVSGLLLFVAFGIRQLKVSSPLVDPALLRIPAVSGAVVVNLVVMFTFFGCALFTTQFLQMVLGYGTLKSGLWFLTAMPPGLIAMAVAVEAAKRIRPVVVVCVGIAISACGAVALCFVTPDSSVWYIMSAQAALTAGLLVATTLTADTILTTAPPERAGAASALTETGTEFGSATGIAILGAIGAGVFGDRLRADSAVPDMSGFPEAARETLVGAVQASAELAGSAQDAFRSAAFKAFTDGLNVVGVVGLAVLIVGLLAAALLLAGVSSPGSPESGTGADQPRGEDRESAPASAGRPVEDPSASPLDR